MSLYPTYILTYILLPTILLLSVRANDDRAIMNRGFTTTAKGFFVVYIAIHHFSQRMPVLGFMRPFADVGFLCVAFFFFSSGYGLTIGFLKRGNLKCFFRKRIMRLYVPFVIANLLTFLLYYFLSKTEVSFSDAVITSITMRTIYSHKVLWYIAVQVLMYAFFYLSFCTQQKQQHRIIMLFLLTLGYIIICIRLEAGFWIYNTVICFPLGAMIATYKDQIERLLDKYFWLIVLLLTAITVWTWSMVYNRTQYRDGSYISAVLFPLLICALSYRIKFRSKTVFHYIGDISYEYYIMQLPCIYIVNEYAFHSTIAIVLVLAMSAISAILAHLIDQAARGLLMKTQQILFSNEK